MVVFNKHTFSLVNNLLGYRITVAKFLSISYNPESGIFLEKIWTVLIIP
jgi:hypothetical protein